MLRGEGGELDCFLEVLAKEEERRGEPLRRFGAHAIVRPGLGERLTGQLCGQRLVTTESVQPGKRRQRLRAGAPVPCRRSGLLEQLERSPGVASIEAVESAADRSAMDVGLRIPRRQPATQLAELRRRRARSARAGLCGSMLECCRDVCVRPVDGEREMAGALLGAGDQLGEAAVKRPPLVGRCFPIDARGQERMREADGLALRARPPAPR